MKCHCGLTIPDWRIDHWPRYRVQQLLELLPRAKRIGDVAEQLGISRNSVIGKIARLRRQGKLHGIVVGWEARPQPTPRPQRKPPMPAKPPEYKIVGNRPQRMPERRGPDGLRLEPGFPMRKLSLLELHATTCRWPIGRLNEPARWFCGNDCDPERPYCAAHHAFAHHR